MALKIIKIIVNRIIHLVRQLLGDNYSNRINVYYIKLLRRNKMTFSDKMVEQRRLWLTNSAYNDWDGSSKVTLKNRAQAMGIRVAETYFIYHKASDIDFNIFPNQFVIKPSHLGGGKGTFIVNNGFELLTQMPFDHHEARKILEECLDMRQQGFHRKPFDHISPQIIVEELVPDENGHYNAHVDYRALVFHGRVCLIKVAFGDPKQLKSSADAFADYYNRNWDLIDYDEITLVGKKLPRKFEKSNKPPHLDELINWSEIIARESGLEFIRVDFFRSNSGFVFGECALRPGLWKKLTPFANQYLGYLWENPDHVLNAFDKNSIKNSDFASLCNIGFY